MKITARQIRSAAAVCLWSWLLLCALPARAAPMPLPPIIEAGFDSWAKGGGVDAILGAWQKGGLMEGSNKSVNQARYLRNLTPALGNYRAHELIESKAIGRTSQVFYITISFERGAVYGRFLVYRTERDWVVQNMDFSERPEAIMPWLAFAGEGAQ